MSEQSPCATSPVGTSPASSGPVTTIVVSNEASPLQTPTDASTPTPTPAPTSTQPAHRGRSAPRSRNGCWTCRSKAAKKRCDEQRPVCGRCARTGLVCDYAPRPKKPSKKRPQAVLAASQTVVQRATPSFPSSDVVLLTPAESPSSVALLADDHEALRYFRTAFAQFHHTKHPQYGCISIMFQLARESPMVMHMALALGFHEMDTRRANPREGSPSSSPSSAVAVSGRPMQHYAAALRLLANMVGETTENDANQQGTLTKRQVDDLDECLSTLWLMLLYEQQFGDVQGRGVTNHLRGAASLAQHRVKSLLQLKDSTSSQKLSFYAVRMLVWIAHIDSAASSAGIGGHFNSSLMNIFYEATKLDSDGEEDDDDDDEFGTGSEPTPPTPVDVLLRMHRYSNPLYRVTWAQSYPQVELLDDLENRSVFNLFTCCVPLRFMLAQLASHNTADAEFRQRAASVARAIAKVRAGFTELLDVAKALSIETDCRQRIVANIRIIVPTFYAVQVEFHRVLALAGHSRSPNAIRLPLGEIMRLAFQTYRHRGDEGLTRVAWPLFVAALETGDLLHRQWILERFDGMAVLGNHLNRAQRLLRDAVTLQDRTGKRADVRAMMPEYGPFILT
ncbi:hypothetical protein SEUCBS139899_007534 [Sporothrix eucalyptigena]|uniref:Zn(2)-C6 fungal-type domain-containing protein n=1 Tax=Sporothrix eucalyptigena TaxID=1812306 RepID=A0ABP0CC45_9PEZI